MSRNPIAAYTHRGGFRMGQVEFKDFLWEALMDPSASVTMGDTAENLALRFNVNGGGVPDWTKALEVVIFLERAVKHPLIKRADRVSKKKVAHKVLVKHSDEIEAPFTDWLAAGLEGWCQFFSEPGAGSDLAGLQTRADRDGDDGRDHRPDRGSDRLGARVRGRGRRLLPRLELPHLRCPLRPAPGPGRGDQRRGAGALPPGGADPRAAAVRPEAGRVDLPFPLLVQPAMTSTAPAERPARYRGLDGLRAIAVTLAMVLLAVGVILYIPNELVNDGVFTPQMLLVPGFATVGDHIPEDLRLKKTVGRLATYLQGYGDLLLRVGLVTLAEGERFNKDIAGSKLIVIDQCGHVPNVEKPGEFNAAVLKFLSEQ